MPVNYLNLGVGPLPIHQQHLEIMSQFAPASEWTLADKFPEDAHVLPWDATTLEEVKDEEVRVIYTSHLLEHIPHTLVPQTLKLWYSKLQKDGRLIVNVPDLIYACKQILKWEQGQLLSGMYTDFAGKKGLMSIIYGTEEQEGEFHMSGFTKKYLIATLTEAGFSDIQVEQLYDAHEMGVLLATAWKR